MSVFEELHDDVKRGLDGSNLNIPIGFTRLNRVIGIRESMYTLAGGYTGSGKTTLIDDAYVLNPYDWYLLHKDKIKTKMKVIYWSMERKKKYKIAKWISRKMFTEHRLIVPVDKILGWYGKMNDVEYAAFLHYKNYIDEMFNSGFITMLEGPDNPTGIYKYIKGYAEGSTDLGLPGIGRVIPIDKFNKKFEKDNPEITLLVVDHIGLLRGEKGLGTKKEVIDKLSEHMRNARDLYGFSPVLVSQFNRDIANPIRIKNGDVEPMLEDFKDSGGTQEDADVVISLFDPMRYKVPDPIGYDLGKLRNPINGNKMYRCLKVLKNSYGVDDVRFGLAFQPEIGMFKEMPKSNMVTELDYDSIIDNRYFL
jgi:hypothetical protein